MPLGFFCVVTLTLALGVGATTVVFAVVNAALIKPLPWPDADRLVRFHSPKSERPASWPQWRTLVALDGLEDVSASAVLASDWVIGAGRDESVPIMHASSALLRLYGLKPALGRFFTAEEDIETRDVVVITDATWRTRYGARLDIIGHSVLLGFAAPAGRQRSYTIVGVLPPEFSTVSAVPDFVLTTGWWHRTRRMPRERLVTVTARLAPGVSLNAVRSRVEGALRQSHADEEPLQPRSLASVVRGDKVDPLATVFLASGVLLMVCCAVVAGLLLERLRARRHELALRQALGASRARIARELLLQHLWLGTAGGLFGLVLAWWSVPVVNAGLPLNFLGHGQVEIDLVVGLFAVGVGVATTAVFGVVPTLWLLDAPLSEVLKDSGRQEGRSRFAMQRVIVAVELGLAMVLVVSATLLGETLMRLTAAPLGFDPTRLAMLAFRTTGAPPPPNGVAVTAAELEQRTLAILGTMSEQVMDVVNHVSTVTGVIGTAASSSLPYWKPLVDRVIEFPDRPELGPAAATQVAVTSGFFSVMRVPLLSGRAFHPTDGLGRYAVVSREFERRFLSAGSLGREFTRVDQPALGPYTVIGVVSDVRTSDRAAAPAPAFYTLSAAAANYFMVRVDGDAATMLPTLRNAIKSKDPRVVVTEMTTMETRMAETLAQDRLRLALAALLGGLTLVLAAVGVYGLAARIVADRRRELGIRVALGAGRADIYRLLARDGRRMATAGMAVGLPCAILAAHTLRGVLFGVSALAPHVYLFSVAVLAGACLVATVLPARRAVDVDAATELRQ